MSDETDNKGEIESDDIEVTGTVQVVETNGLYALNHLTEKEASMAAAYIQGHRSGNGDAAVPASKIKECKVGEYAVDKNND